MRSFPDWLWLRIANLHGSDLQDVSGIRPNWQIHEQRRSADSLADISCYESHSCSHMHHCLLSEDGFRVGQIPSNGLWTGDLSYLNHVSLPNSPSSNLSLGNSDTTTLEHLPAEHRFNNNIDGFSDQSCLLHHQRTIYDINSGFQSKKLPPDPYDLYHEVLYSLESVRDSHYCQHSTDGPLTTWDPDLHTRQYISETIQGSVPDQDVKYSGLPVLQTTSYDGLTMLTAPSQPQDFYTISAHSFGPDLSGKHFNQASITPSTPRSNHYSPARAALAAVSHPPPLARPCLPYSLTPKPQLPRTPTDIYTPPWIQGAGRYREGWCGLCRPPRWLLLKNSAFWYDKTYGHGISAVTGEYFDGPKDVRVHTGDGAGLGSVFGHARCDSTETYSGHEDLEMRNWEERKLGHEGGIECGNEKQQKEGLCGTCGAWIVLGSGRKGKVLGMSWFRHAYKCQNRTHTSKSKVKMSRGKRAEFGVAAKC